MLPGGLRVGPQRLKHLCELRATHRAYWPPGGVEVAQKASGQCGPFSSVLTVVLAQASQGARKGMWS